MKRDRVFLILLIISSVLLSGSAAYFGVYGLSKLFSGSNSLLIIIAFTGLEFSKLILASFLYRNFSIIKMWMKIYSFMSLFILMLLTSAGIYGYLTYSYKKISSNMKVSENKISVIQLKKNFLMKDIERFEKMAKAKSGRLIILNDVRRKQEDRIDKYAGKKFSLYQMSKNIERADIEIKKLSLEITDINKNITDKYNLASNIESEITIMRSEVELKYDLGPLQFVSKMFNMTIDRTVNLLIMLIIFVFDPLAIVIVLAINVTVARMRKFENLFISDKKS